MLYVDEAGAPGQPALVFLHGGGLSGRQWRPQLEQLSDGYFCLAPDLPEQGRSASIGPFLLDDAADQVAALIAARVPSGRATLVGNSLGGAVALALAVRAPERVERLIVTGTSTGLGSTLAWVMRVSAGMMGWFPEDWLLDRTLSEFRIPEPHRAALREDLRLGLRPDFNRHVADALATVPLPAAARALVLVGARETALARQQARRMAERIAGARGATVRGVGHVWNLEAPELFCATVRAFCGDGGLPEGVEGF